jgi:hypothetical protein
MVNGAMLQAQGELLAPIPVPIVAPPSSTPPASSGVAGAAAGTSAAIAAAGTGSPAHATLRIVQPRPGGAAGGAAAVSVADAAASVAGRAADGSMAADAAAGPLSVTDVLNAIAAESGGHAVVTADGVPPIRRPQIEVDSASIMLPGRKTNNVVLRGIVAAAVVLVTAIVLILITR